MNDNTKSKSDCLKCVCANLGIDEIPCVFCGGNYDVLIKYIKDGALEKTTNEYPKPTIKDSGERREFETGAVRDCAEGKGRCDLLPLDVVAGWMNNIVLDKIAMFVRTHDVTHLRLALDYIAEKHFSCKADLVLEMAIHMEEGLKKYPERNWENGISVHSYIDSGVRHYLKVLRGDDDENHLRACVWNLMCCIWTMGYKPEMDDLPKQEGKQ